MNADLEGMSYKSKSFLKSSPCSCTAPEADEETLHCQLFKRSSVKGLKPRNGAFWGLQNHNIMPPAQHGRLLHKATVWK